MVRCVYGDYSSTHVLRHSIGHYSREEAELDTAQAMLSQSSASQTEGDARLDVNEKVTGLILGAEKFLQPKCNQRINVVNL